MLTDIDIHYLVGLLTRTQEANDVAIELGDMVYDSAAKKERDVDITVSHADQDGAIKIYKGIEVKDHTTRPLNVQHVEQLCLKLDDMPSITHKSIVSASGYTDGAISKAQAHEVELLEIVDWPNPNEGFNVKFEDSAFTMIESEWVNGPHVRINISEKDQAKFPKKIDPALKVVTESGDPYPNVLNIADLSLHAHSAVSDQLQKQTGPTTVKHGEAKSLKTTVRFDKIPYIRLTTGLVAVENCLVTGKVEYHVHDKPVFKVLRQQGSDKPLTGCAIVEMKNQNLMGISVSNLNNKITALRIPYADRVKKKVLKHQI